jgi:hemerythrin superfamily protein
MSDAVDLLKEQHAEVTALFMQIERASDPALRYRIFRTIDTSLRTHATIEEKIFYPAFRERARHRLEVEEVNKALHDHDQVKAMLGQLERTSPESAGFRMQLASLKAAVQQHVIEEETGMLKQARRIFTPPQLEDLAFRMEQAATHASPVYEMAGAGGRT